MSANRIEAGPFTATKETGACPEGKSPHVRRGRKRRLGLPQRPAIAVRGLWESATPEERERAHRTAGTILENWVGLATKQEVAQRLGIPPLRVWQLSQQAASGMVAGLLKQPRRRGKGATMEVASEEDPKKLRKRIQELEKKLALAEEVIGVLRTFPENRNRVLPGETPAAKGKKKRAKRIRPAESPIVGNLDAGAPSPRTA